MAATLSWPRVAAAATRRGPKGHPVSSRPVDSSSAGAVGDGVGAEDAGVEDADVAVRGPVPASGRGRGAGADPDPLRARAPFFPRRSTATVSASGGVDRVPLVDGPAAPPDDGASAGEGVGLPFGAPFAVRPFAPPPAGPGDGRPDAGPAPRASVGVPDAGVTDTGLTDTGLPGAGFAGTGLAGSGVGVSPPLGDASGGVELDGPAGAWFGARGAPAGELPDEVPLTPPSAGAAPDAVEPGADGPGVSLPDAAGLGACAAAPFVGAFPPAGAFAPAGVFPADDEGVGVAEPDVPGGPFGSVADPSPRPGTRVVFSFPTPPVDLPTPWSPARSSGTGIVGVGSTAGHRAGGGPMGRPRGGPIGRPGGPANGAIGGGMAPAGGPCGPAIPIGAGAPVAAVCSAGAASGSLPSQSPTRRASRRNQAEKTTTTTSDITRRPRSAATTTTTRSGGTKRDAGMDGSEMTWVVARGG